MVLFRITENEPSKMHNVRPYVYSRPWSTVRQNGFANKMNGTLERCIKIPRNLSFKMFLPTHIWCFDFVCAANVNNCHINNEEF